MKITTKNLDQFVDSQVWWPKNAHYKMDDAEVEAIQNEILKFPNCQMLQIGTNFGWTAFNVLKQLNKVNGFLDTVDLSKSRKSKLQKQTDRWIKHFGSVVQKHDLQWIIAYHTEGSTRFFENSCQNKKYHVEF